MEGMIFLVFILASLVICVILFNLIKGAVKEGTLEALIEYEKVKSKRDGEE